MFYYDMSKRTLPVVLASFVLVFAGNIAPAQTASIPKKNDLGVIDVSADGPSSHILADGRVCTVTPSILPGGKASLAATIIETNASGVKRSSLALELPVDGRVTTFAFDKDTVMTVALENKDAVLPGRHLSETQVAEIASRELPRTRGFTCKFKDGVWEILELQKNVWGTASITTNADGHVFVYSTNATRLALKVRDADGKAEQVKSP